MFEEEEYSTGWNWFLFLKYIHWTKVLSIIWNFRQVEWKNFIHHFSLPGLLPSISIMDFRELPWQSPHWDRQVGGQNEVPLGVRTGPASPCCQLCTLAWVSWHGLLSQCSALGRRWALNNLYFICVKGLVEHISGLSALWRIYFSLCHVAVNPS